MGAAHWHSEAADTYGGGAAAEYEWYDDVSDAVGDERDRRYRERVRARRAAGGHDSAAYDDPASEDLSARALRTSARTSARPLALVQPPALEFRLQAPLTFDEGQGIADRFREGDPVIVDLRDCETELALRLIDFCSGLTYALDGSLEFVTERVLLLAPHGVDLSGSAGVGLRGQGFYNRL